MIDKKTNCETFMGEIGYLTIDQLLSSSNPKFVKISRDISKLDANSNTTTVHTDNHNDGHSDSGGASCW